jgi:CelD/BcsL family acetyltransferase involved in cellulose biosynthesis
MNLFVPPDDTRLWRPVRAADPGAYVVVIKQAHDLTEADRVQWANLTRAAHGDNIFAADWFMASALRHCTAGKDVRLAIVRAIDGQWIGVLPLNFEVLFGNCPLPSWQSWQSANQFDPTALIARGAEHVFWHCLLAQLDRKPGAALALCCEGLPVDDPATAALIDVCLVEGRMLHRKGGFTRPMRVPGPRSDDAAAARRKLDRRLDSLMRKLEREVGAVRIVTLPRETDPAAWMEQFLALEKSGWKGSHASALASEPCTAGLFREVIRIAHQQDAVRLMSLEAAGEVIAMTSWFIGKTRASGFKMAYDEAYRSYAPGRLLMRAVADASAASHPAAAFDSCARGDAPPDPLWPGSREFANYIVGIGSPARRKVLAGTLWACNTWQARRGSQRRVVAEPIA